MTSPILSFSAQNQATYSRLSRQIDCDLILSRVKTSVSVSDPLYVQYDKICKEYQQKRDKRRQMRVRGVNNDEQNSDEKEHLENNKNSEKISVEIDQWIRNMKSPQFDLEYYREGSFESSNVLKDISKIKRSVGRNFVEEKNNKIVNHGANDGKVNAHEIFHIEGRYCRGKVDGIAKVIFDDRSWLEGVFKNGVVQGVGRYFDSENNLSFVGMHRNGIPTGTCWKFNGDGGFIVGKVDIDGKLTGSCISYIYPDLETALLGSFRNGAMVCAKHCQIVKVKLEAGCILMPEFLQLDGSSYKREISTHEFVTTSPTLMDPYESSLIEVKLSDLPDAEEGLFAKKLIRVDTVIAFYQGVKLPQDYKEEDTWKANGYKIFDPSNTPEGTLDILEEYRSTSQYCASLAHKTNHSFQPNSEFQVFDHPRWGMVPSISSTRDIQVGEEVTVRYGYDLGYCPDWYLDTWNRGAHYVAKLI